MTNYDHSMKSFRLAVAGMAVCAACAVIFPTGAQAFTIDAKLTSFLNADANLNNTGPAGGIGTFELLTDVTGTPVDFLGTTFMAQCLEPNEYVSTGNTYTFDVVSLSDAPTSRVGGMGTTNAGWIESIMSGLGFESVEDVAAANAVTRSAMQMATYEMAFETAGVFDFTAGAATLTGSGLAVGTDVMTALATASPLESFALLNVGMVNNVIPGPAFQGQDFAVFTTTETVSNPAPLGLLGLGLLGLAGVIRKTQ